MTETAAGELVWAAEECSEAAFDYEFSAWPDEQSWEQSVYDLFRNMTTRQVVTFTETGFAAFRASLERSRFTLREIERTPHHEPETVL
jgi:hypothetical protein